MLSFLSRLCGCRCDSPTTDRKTTAPSEAEKAPDAPAAGPPPGGQRINPEYARQMKEPLALEQSEPQKLTSAR